jgi:DNA-binding transcriptional MerR regulator
MTINELANEAGVTTRTIRYYVEQGVLPPPEAGYPAQYTEDHIYRLALIRRLKDEYLPLDEIRAMLDGLDTAQVQALLAEHTPQMQRKTAAAPGLVNSAADYINEVLNRGTTREQLRNKVAPNQYPSGNQQGPGSRPGTTNRRAYDEWEEEQENRNRLSDADNLAGKASTATDLEMEARRETAVVPPHSPAPQAEDALSAPDAAASSLAGAAPPSAAAPGGMAPPAPASQPGSGTPAQAGPPPAALAPAPAPARSGPSRWSFFPRKEEAAPAPTRAAAETAMVAPDLARRREAAPAPAAETSMNPPAYADQAGGSPIQHAAAASQTPAPADETWRRIVITPGIELHILARPEGRWNHIVTRIVDAARHILADTPENEGENP